MSHRTVSEQPESRITEHLSNQAKFYITCSFSTILSNLFKIAVKIIEIVDTMTKAVDHLRNTCLLTISGNLQLCEKTVLSFVEFSFFRNLKSKRQYLPDCEKSHFKTSFFTVLSQKRVSHFLQTNGFPVKKENQPSLRGLV